MRPRLTTTIITMVMTRTKCLPAGVWKPGRKISREKLESILHELANTDRYGQVLRAKGMLPDGEGTWHYFDLVPEETEIRDRSADLYGQGVRDRFQSEGRCFGKRLLSSRIWGIDKW